MTNLMTLLLLALTVAGCSEDPRVQALAGTADFIAQGYEALAQASDILQEKTRAFCAAPTENSLAATRQSWDAAMGAWMRVQPLRFGAIREENRDYRMQFWPDPRDLVAADTQALVDGDTEFNAETIAAQGVAVQGLPAIEYLLFPESGHALARFHQQPRRCAALTAIAANVATIAAGLHQDWSAEGADYGARLTEYGDSARFADADAALAVVAASLSEAAHAVADRKLGRPLGRHGADPTQPEALESPRARRSLANIADNLAGIERLFTAGKAFGIADLLRGPLAAADLADQIATKLQAARAQVDELPRPLYPALTAGAELTPYRRLHATTAELDALLTKRLPAALGVSLGFNFNDGD